LAALRRLLWPAGVLLEGPFFPNAQPTRFVVSAFVMFCITLFIAVATSAG
jgi:hypothetical protein